MLVRMSTVTSVYSSGQNLVKILVPNARKKSQKYIIRAARVSDKSNELKKKNRMFHIKRCI